jgi:hypothetical protein
MTPCSPKKVNRCLPPAFTLVSCLAYFTTLKMEATCSSETSVDFHYTALYPKKQNSLKVSSLAGNRNPGIQPIASYFTEQIILKKQPVNDDDGVLGSIHMDLNY